METTKYGTEQKVYYALRIACAICFIGHGSFGIITKEIWCNYFGVMGISRNTSYILMPYVGIMDVCMGLLILFYPLRAVFAWLVIWGLMTASMRPLSGEPFAEFIERAGNYGAPLALLLLTFKGRNNFKSWFKTVGSSDVQSNPLAIKRVYIALRIIVFLLLLGHGWLNLIEKKSLLNQYASLGFSNTAEVAHIIGSLEILAACISLIKPLHSVLMVFFIWKMVSELFYPQWEIFEFIERGGSYGAILALWFLTKPSFRYHFNENYLQVSKH